MLFLLFAFLLHRDVMPVQADWVINGILVHAIVLAPVDLAAAYRVARYFHQPILMGDAIEVAAGCSETGIAHFLGACCNAGIDEQLDILRKFCRQGITENGKLVLSHSLDPMSL